MQLSVHFSHDSLTNIFSVAALDRAQESIAKGLEVGEVDEEYTRREQVRPMTSSSRRAHKC